ncbi:MAG: cyclic nucleotide-binding domain-containing protein [Chlorobi bacterium]|nr:cyclic nucleotide-binding domain-containing protein [Chlorobiota bacterium]
MGSSISISTIDDKISVLKNTRIFSETENFVLYEIASVLTEVRMGRGQVIFKKGEEGDKMYIIKEGSVRVHDGGHVLSRLVKGQVFGEFALFDEEVRSASITTEEPTTLYLLGQEDFYKLLIDKPEVTQGVLKKVIRRIREMNELESKLARSYLKIQKQKNEIEIQHRNILEQKTELEKRNAQLTKLNEEKNELIGFVSHGLRNPLTSSLCVVDLFQQETENLHPDQQEYLRLVQNSLRKMNSLINQTLDIDIIELQRDNLKNEKVNLADIVRQLEESFKYTLSLKKLELSLNLNELCILADSNFIYLILDNLLSNAIKFSPREKTIAIDLFQKENKVCVEISDEGPGISNEALKILFDNPKAHGRKTDKTGLPIVKKYVEAMNGQIYCNSRAGEGTTFRVEFDSIDEIL